MSVQTEQLERLYAAVAKLPRAYFDDGQGRLVYHGDARELLPLVGKVGAVVTDPPYGINTKSDGNGKLSPWADYINSAMFYEWWIGQCRGRLTDDGCLWSFLNWRSLVTFQKAACDLAWPIESLLVWDKCWIGPGGTRGLRPSYELVALWAMLEFSIENRGLPDIQRFQWSSQKPNGHPAEKPEPLMRWLIETTAPGVIVVDPFAGSGTTLRAAKDLGRFAIGFELDERFAEITSNRLRQEVLF